MGNDWIQDKAWSDKFLPEVKRILGLYLIGEAPLEEDQAHNTDLIVLRMESVRIGCRIRRYETSGGYQTFEKHKEEFTIRNSRPSGVLSELAKIITGWGDYFFYAFSSQDEQSLLRWTLCRYGVFRLWFNRHLVQHRGGIPGTYKQNKDRSSDFIAINFNALPADFIVADNWRHTNN